MPGFRDYLKSDLDFFLNTEEFATVHDIDGRLIKIVIDEDLLKERQSKVQNLDGLYIGDVLFHVKKLDFGDRPAIGEVIKLDRKIYRVADVQEDEGVYSISLKANES